MYPPYSYISTNSKEDEILKNIDYSKTTVVSMFNTNTLFNTSSNHIITSYGAGPCIILCARNRYTNKTTMTHIDGLVITVKNVIPQFIEYKKDDSDIFIVGGDNSRPSNEKIINLLNNFREYMCLCC